MDESPKFEEMTPEYLDEFLIKLSTARLGVRRKLVILKKTLELWGVISNKPENMIEKENK